MKVVTSVYTNIKLFILKRVQKEYIWLLNTWYNAKILGLDSAIGTITSLIIMYKNKRVKKECVDNLPFGSACQMNPKQNITSHFFFKLTNHFSKFKLQGRFLLMGSCPIYITQLWMRWKNVIFYFLYFIIQPMSWFE